MATRERSSVCRQFHALFRVGTVRELTDGQLLKWFATGRGEAAELAFAALVERHGPMVLRTCRGILRDEHHAEDAFQATFLVLVRKSGSLWVHDSLGPWLQQVACRAARCARSALVQRQGNERRAAELTASQFAAQGDRLEWESVLHEELERLPERYRGPLVLCDLEGLTHDQAAVRLGCPVGTIKSRLARGRDRLRDRMVRRGYPRSAGMLVLPILACIVPPALGASTIRTALRLALAESTSACVPATVSSLVRGVLRIMARARLKSLALPVLAAVATAGVCLFASAASEDGNRSPAPSDRPAAGLAPREDKEAADRQAWRERLSVTGRVVMPDGAPAAGAIVESAIVEDEPPSRVRADDHGLFRLDGVFGNGGRFHARSADGTYQSTRKIAADDARVAAASPLELRLAPAVAHEVTVLAQGRPASGVEVVAEGVNFKVKGITGAEGKVMLRCPAGEPIKQMVAWHPELGVDGVRQREEQPARDVKQLSLIPPGPHKVRVVDPDGRAVAGLEFGAHFQTEESDWILAGEIVKARLRTDAEGVATIPWAPRRKLKYIEVRIAGSDWKVDETDRDRITEGVTTVHVRRELTVNGRLIMPEGASALGILVSGFGFGPKSSGDIPYARARRDGSFTFRVPSGHGFVLGIADREWASDPWSGLILEKDSSKPAEIALKVYPATPLTVRVTRGTARIPVPDAWIDVENRGRVEWVDSDGKKRTATGRVGRWWRTDADGVARGGVGRGEQRVTISTGAWREERTLKVATGDPIQVEFRRAWLGERRVTGRLMLDGAPFRPSRTLKAYAWSMRERLIPLKFEPKVRPDGTFDVAFDAGNLTLYFHDEEKQRSATARIGPEDTDAQPAMIATATYAGTLLDENNRPLADRTLHIRIQTALDDAVPARRTDGAGRFRFTGVPAKAPLQLWIENEPKLPEYYIFDQRMFDPAETRDDDRVTTHRSDSSASAARPSVPLADRLKVLVRDARLSGMHVLMVLEGDASSGVSERLLEGSAAAVVLKYLPERVAAPRLTNEAEVVKSHGWPNPAAGEIFLVALDGDGKTLGAGRIPTGKADDALRRCDEFLQRHAPPPRNASARLSAARKEAAATGRRVWVIHGGPRCGFCFRLARWIDDHRAVLEKDFVVLEVMDAIDDHDDEVIGKLPRKEQSVPWHAFTEPDGTVLATSEGPLGNIGFPASVEELRHFRGMLDRAAQRLTPDEITRLVRSLSQAR